MADPPGPRARLGAVLHHHPEHARQWLVLLAKQCRSTARSRTLPGCEVADNVRIQYRLLTEQLGIERVALVYGWSMGGQQAYHWAALYPEIVERIAVVCGSARTAPHNQVFLEGIKYALMADPAWRDGYFAEPPVREIGRASCRKE